MNQAKLKWFNVVSWGILAAWTVFLVQLTVWYYFPVKPVEYFDLPAQVLNPDKKVKRGEYLEFKLVYQKHVNLPGQISRSLVNDRVVTLSCETGASMPGGKRAFIVRVFIPFNVWPGKYRLVTDVSYRVNPINIVHVRYDTEWFEVE